MYKLNMDSRDKTSQTNCYRIPNDKNEIHFRLYGQNKSHSLVRNTCLTQE